MDAETEKIVCQNLERRYFRFRPTKFYGGIATADVTGCNLRCVFCWSWKHITNPRSGQFYSPAQVADKLISIAAKRGFSQARLSGGEPTIGRAHLLSLLEKIKNTDLNFILETNGTLIDSAYAEAFAEFDFLHVRVCLKGFDAEQFQRITGRDAGGFELQLQALENLKKAGVPYHAALIQDFYEQSKAEKLMRRLREIDPALQIENENLIYYPAVKSRMQKAKLFPI